MSTIISVPNPSGLSEMSTLVSQPPRPTHLNTGGIQVQAAPPYSRKEQMKKIIDTIRSREVKIAVITNGIESRRQEEDRGLATSIATELNKMLSGSKALVYEYVIKSRDNWFDYLRSVNVTYYIFIELPPHREYQAATPESDFFNPRSSRITEVVVVRRNRWATTPGGSRISAYTPIHYLERFQHVEGSARDIAAMALCHFAGEGGREGGREGGEEGGREGGGGR